MIDKPLTNMIDNQRFMKRRGTRGEKRRRGLEESVENGKRSRVEQEGSEGSGFVGGRENARDRGEGPRKERRGDSPEQVNEVTSKRNVKEERFYNLLGVPTDVTTHTLRRTFKRLAKRYHPDKNTESGERFKEISMAYLVLVSRRKRQIYDLKGEEGIKLLYTLDDFLNESSDEEESVQEEAEPRETHDELEEDMVVHQEPGGGQEGARTLEGREEEGVDVEVQQEPGQEGGETLEEEGEDVGHVGSAEGGGEEGFEQRQGVGEPIGRTEIEDLHPPNGGERRVEAEEVFPEDVGGLNGPMACPACQLEPFTAGELKRHFATHRIIKSWNDLVKRSLTGK